MKTVDMPISTFLQILDQAVVTAGRPIAGAELAILGIERKDLRELERLGKIQAHRLKNNKTGSMELGYSVCKGGSHATTNH